MKRSITLLLFVIFFHPIVKSQNAYIQVNGEPGLHVFLNNQFKGKTTAELNGYVIENVIPGSNTLKIVKEGYAPYEEVITVKPGEVFAYKVKPFVKHTILISEQGNTQTSQKQATLQTGKLVIQSVPIEIKFSIPDIEGGSNLSKTKDQWMAESVPAGFYTILFTYNGKNIEKRVEITGNETTRVFANMLSGEINVSSSLDAKKAEQLEKAAFKNMMDSICHVYKYRSGLTESQFREYNPEVAAKMNIGGTLKKSTKGVVSGPLDYGITNGIVNSYTYFIYKESGSETKAYELYMGLLNYYKKRFPKMVSTSDNEYAAFFTMTQPGTQLSITFLLNHIGKFNKIGSLEVRFRN